MERYYILKIIQQVINSMYILTDISMISFFFNLFYFIYLFIYLFFLSYIEMKRP